METVADPLPLAGSEGLWRGAMRRIARDRVAMVCAAIVGAFVLAMVAVSFGWLAADWNRQAGVTYARPTFLGPEPAADRSAQGAGEGTRAEAGTALDIRDIDPLAPSAEAVEARARQIRSAEPARRETLTFGGDQWGRDVLAKTVKGAQSSMLVGFGAAVLASIIGTLLGAIAGYGGRAADDACEWFYAVFTSVPWLMLILALAAVLKQRGLIPIVLILGCTGWTGIYRLIRAEYLKHAQREYVRAADAIGAGRLRRMFVHILPNVSHVILVQLAQNVVGFIKAEVILSYLGFGVAVDMVSWGTMLAEAQSELVVGKWWQLAAVAAAMTVLITAFSLLTDALRDALDPRLS
jgi:oligopeptide transport system permease protein